MAKKAPQNAHQSTHVVYQKRKSHRHQRIKLRKNRTQGKWKRYSSCTKYNISVVVYAVTELKSNKNDSSMCHRWEWEKKSEKSKEIQQTSSNTIKYIKTKSQRDVKRAQNEIENQKKREKKWKTQTFTHGTDTVFGASEHFLSTDVAAVAVACNLIWTVMFALFSTQARAYFNDNQIKPMRTIRFDLISDMNADAERVHTKRWTVLSVDSEHTKWAHVMCSKHNLRLWEYFYFNSLWWLLDDIITQAMAIVSLRRCLQIHCILTRFHRG